MEVVIAFFVSVAAGVVSYYICKWLDRHVKGQ
jgi:capsular polysaccharide biosynthesis protein